MFMFIRAEQPVRIFGAKNTVGLELFSLCVSRTSAYWVLVMKNGVYYFAFSFQNDCRFMNQAVHVSHPTYCLRAQGCANPWSQHFYTAAKCVLVFSTLAPRILE